MSLTERTTRTINASEARQQWSSLLKQVHQSQDRVIVERSGVPIAAIISAADLERLIRLEAERDRDFAVVDLMRAAFEDVPFEEIEREAAKAIAEVRADKRREREAAARVESG